jgi:PEP-CTERM motif-containing protein
MRWQLAFVVLVCVFAMVAAPAFAQNITNVVETNGDNEATDTITAKWTGQTFPITVANEPIPGAVIGGTPYTVGTFGHLAPAYVDRNHRYANHSVDAAAVPPGFVIPAYLVGQEYIMSGNDNRDNATYMLDVTVASPSTAYMLIDNRLGDPNSSNADPPSFGPTKMQWILDQGWIATSNGLNRTANPQVPDEVPIDEGADNTINQWFSVYRKDFPAGTFRLLQADNAGQDMYGVVVVPIPEPSTIALLSFAIAGMAIVIRRRRHS